MKRLIPALAFIAAVPVHAWAQNSGNPYRTWDNPSQGVDGWVNLPAGRRMGAVGDVTVDPDGVHVWAVVRCDAFDPISAPGRFGNECVDSDLDPILKFDHEGNVVESFGGGMFIWPHGMDVDPDGNVWVTDGVGAARTPEGTRGHQVVKFSPDGEVLLTLGTPGVPGGGRSHLNGPSDVVVADDGSIFVADGHANGTNNRVVKYAPDGRYLMEWGRTGYAPGGVPDPARHRAGRKGSRVRGRPVQQSDPDLRPRGKFPRTVDSVRAPERNSVRRQRPDLRGRLRIGRCPESRLGDGDQDR